MPAKSLYDLAKSRAIKNIAYIDDISDLPYTFVAPILKHIQNPAQLADLEQNCPQLLGETGELWLRFVKRDIPNWDKKPHQPRDERNWSKVYKKLKKEAEIEKEQQEEQLREQMAALQKNRVGNQTKIIEGRAGLVPQVRRSAGSGGGWGRSAAPAKTGKVAFDKLRRGIFDQKQARPKAAQMPAHLLQQRKGQVKQAPARMIRMQEAEAPRRMMVSKGASASLTAKDHSTTASKPTPQSNNTATPEKPQRPSLPAGQHFTAPKIRTQAAGAPTAQKRRREEPQMFMPSKRRA